MESSHKVVFGDSRAMIMVPNESVDLIVTSPPYWQLKDYGNGSLGYNGDQIGYNDNYEDYINNLNLVWKECYRILKDGCRLCINIGDQYARSAYYGSYRVISIKSEIVKFCEVMGFSYMGAIIWQKVTTCNTSGGGSVMGSFPYPRNGIVKLDYEYILLFRKPGLPPQVTKEVKEKSRLTKEEWSTYFQGHWHFAGEKQGKHLAMFPEELPKRCIKMFSFVGDMVFDPFLGSGTTMLAALNLGRNSIGYELNDSFLSIIKERLTQKSKRDQLRIEIVRQEASHLNIARDVAILPYIFRDPVKLEKKVDPKNCKFESKIDGVSELPRETYYRVKTILSSHTLVLGNGEKIRLLGIKEIKGKRNAAVQFLKEKTKGKKVFIRFDTIQRDNDNNLLCYLYLSNRTFLNAHLLKFGLADVDTTLDYKHKDRFLAKRRAMQ